MLRYMKGRGGGRETRLRITQFRPERTEDVHLQEPRAGMARVTMESWAVASKSNNNNN